MHREVLTVSDTRREARSDFIISETQVAIALDGRVEERVSCLPNNLEELAIGYWLSRGVAVMNIEVHSGDDEVLLLARTTGAVQRAVVASQHTITEGQVFHFVEELDRNCPLYKTTGGTHVVAIFHELGALFIEDISRHCAIDKVIGKSIKNGVELTESVLVTSCRQTASTVTKAIYARIPIIVSIATTTDLAIKNADFFGISIVGFARGRQFNIYCHDWRILTRHQ